MGQVLGHRRELDFQILGLTLHHAAKEPVFGLWLIEELGEHGYKLSPGTLW